MPYPSHYHHPHPGMPKPEYALRTHRRCQQCLRVMNRVSVHSRDRRTVELLPHGAMGWAVQEERERVPLRGGERGCSLGQFPDPGVRAAAGVVCGVPVRVVTLVAFGPVAQGADARPGCGPGSGFPLRR